MAQDDVTMLDEQGKEIKVSRQEWLAEVLPEGLRRAWDEPEALYAVLVAAINMKAGAALNDAMRRLAEIDKNPERPLVLQGVLLMQTGNPAEAEKLFRSFLEQHGPTASILTNLAKIQYDRGEKVEAEATLQQALALDANLEGTLGWHLAVLRQRGGDAAAEAELRKLAEEPRNWRARLWIAGGLLKQKRNADALELYRRIVAQADLPPEGLVQMTSDMGRAGMAREMVDLIHPVYDLKTHGPMVGLNLLQGMITAGMSMEAADLLVELDSIKHPAMTEILKDMSNRLVERTAAAKRNTPAAVAGGGEVKVGAVPLINPVWTGWLNKPQWLPPQPALDAVKVAIFSLADMTRARTDDGQRDRSRCFWPSRCACDPTRPACA
jgi:tetratricopeptide (TPR) repeat protein